MHRWEREIIKKKTTTKWKTQEANLIKKRQFYLVLSKFSLHRSLNDLVILPLRSRRTPSICSAVLSKEIIRQQKRYALKKTKHPRMEASSDGCDIIDLFIYLSIRFLRRRCDLYRVIAFAHSALGCSDDTHSGATTYGITMTRLCYGSNEIRVS